MKPKLAIIGVKGYPGYGGSARANSQLVKRLQHKYDITLYAISSHANVPHSENIKQIVFKSYSNTKLTMILYYLKSLLHCLFLGKYDVIHSYHNISGLLIPFLRIRYPVLFNIRALSFDSEKKWNVLERFIVNFSMIIAIKFSNAIATVDKSSILIVKKYTNKTIHYIPNGVEKYHLIYDLKKTINPTYDIAFSANRVVYMKGLHLLLRALNKTEKNYKTQIIGNLNHIESYKNELLREARNLNCEFIGLIKTRDELFQNLINSKLFVFPSYLEGMSNQLLEVAALNIPIIASDIPQNTSIFTDEEVLFFKSGDVHDLQNKIEYAFNNINNMKTLAQRAQNKVYKNHDWDKITINYESIYTDLINNSFDKKHKSNSKLQEVH